MILCIELISLHVWMFIPCVNDHCGHYLQWLFIFGQAMLYCFISFCLITLCLLHMHFKLFAYNDCIVLLFLGNTCSYGSRASQILELGMSEFCSTIPNSHVKSRVCFRVLLALFRTKFACNSAFRNPIFRWESCKGKVWESVKKSSRVCTQEEPRDWISQLASCQRGTRVKHARELKGHASCSTTGQNFQSGQAVISQIKLTIRSNREAVLPECPIWWKMTFLIPYTPYYKYPYTHEM